MTYVVQPRRWRAAAVVTLIAGLLSVVALGVAPAAHAGAPTAASADAALQRQLQRLIAAPGGPPGALVVVQRGARRAVFNLGVANRSTGRRIQLTDHWRIASVTKSLTSATALALVSRGQMSLGMTLGDTVSGLKPAWSEVTLAQLMQHTSGVPSYTTQPGFLQRLQASPRGPWTPRQIMDVVPNELEFTPGTRYEYSNSGTILIGLMIEAVTGYRYSQMLDRYVLDRLALRRSFLPEGFRLPAPFVHGYDNNLTGPREDLSEALNASGVWAAGGITSAPLDLHAYIRAFVRGRLFDAATRAAALRFRPGGGEPFGPGTNSAGLGIFRYQTDCGTVLGHTGNFPGYSAFIASTPDGTRSVTVLITTALSQGLGKPAFPMLRRVFRLAACSALATGSSRFTG